MKTFEQFAEEVDISRLSPEKQKAARKKAAADGIKIKGDRDRDDERKALPGSRGGALAGGALVPTRKAAADKGGSIVKAKQSALKAPDKVEKAKVKVHHQPQRPGTTRPDPESDKKKKLKSKGQGDGIDWEKYKKFAKGAYKVAKGAHKLAKKVGERDGKQLGNAEGDVKGPQMGIYNPK